MKENFVYFLKNFLFYFIIGICVCGPIIGFIIPIIFITAAAFVCAMIATINRSEKLFTKHFWFAVILLNMCWVVYWWF